MRNKMHHHGKSSKWITVKVSMILLFVVIFSLALMLLWNWLMPEIFGFKAISFVQAIGLLLLSKLLFSGIGRGHGHHHGHYWHRRHGKSEEDLAAQTGSSCEKN